jgi:hypothetical protein
MPGLCRSSGMQPKARRSGAPNGAAPFSNDTTPSPRARRRRLSAPRIWGSSPTTAPFMMSRGILDNISLVSRPSVVGRTRAIYDRVCSGSHLKKMGAPWATGQCASVSVSVSVSTEILDTSSYCRFATISRRRVRRAASPTDTDTGTDTGTRTREMAAGSLSQLVRMGSDG